MAQRLGVVGGEVLDVVDDEAGPFQRQQVAREVQRRRIGEDVALGEGARLGVAVAQAGDAVVEQAPARLQQPARVCA